MSFQDRLAVAYKDFKNWCRANKVHCSHPLFTPNSVTCTCTCTCVQSICSTAGFLLKKLASCTCICFIYMLYEKERSEKPRFGKRRRSGPIYRAKLTIAVC